MYKPVVLFTILIQVVSCFVDNFTIFYDPLKEESRKFLNEFESFFDEEFNYTINQQQPLIKFIPRSKVSFKSYILKDDNNKTVLYCENNDVDCNTVLFQTCLSVSQQLAPGYLLDLIQCVLNASDTYKHHSMAVTNEFLEKCFVHDKDTYVQLINCLDSTNVKNYTKAYKKLIRKIRIKYYPTLLINGQMFNDYQKFIRANFTQFWESYQKCRINNSTNSLADEDCLSGEYARPIFLPILLSILGLTGIIGCCIFVVNVTKNK